MNTSGTRNKTKKSHQDTPNTPYATIDATETRTPSRRRRKRINIEGRVERVISQSHIDTLVPPPFLHWGEFYPRRTGGYQIWLYAHVSGETKNLWISRQGVSSVLFSSKPEFADLSRQGSRGVLNLFRRRKGGPRSERMPHRSVVETGMTPNSPYAGSSYNASNKSVSRSQASSRALTSAGSPCGSSPLRMKACPAPS